ncbi:hypothetical protein VTN77DRAFT_1887 [Rasamsonia byssochlamydoides]|uniref:uncharacterized protein n=1 Tax=Rasamsonia byssochlamydoides TaxID=89139 RepID=UPI00374344C7
MSGGMSLEDSSSRYYMPTTPPGAGVQIVGSAHSRNTSASSIYSHHSSPESVVTCITTPSTSPPNQHGPALLPKIRTQDVIVEPASTGGPKRHRRVLSNTRNPPGFMPYPVSRPSLQRSVIDTSDCAALVSPISTAPVTGSSTASGLSSPIALTSSSKRKSSGGHSRSSSASSIDEATLSRYGYPTYRQLPKYVSQSQVSPTTPVTPASFTYPTYPQTPGISVPRPIQVPLPTQPSYAVVPSPQYDYLHTHSALPSPIVYVAPPVDSPSCSTTLLSYLTSPTQAINLVPNVSIVPTRGLQDYFWWDIRNLRSWSTFSLSTFNEISGLTKLLKTPIPAHLAPQAMVPSSRLSPESESALINLIADIYAPRVNAALAVSQGRDHLRLYPAPDANTRASRDSGGAHFLANYASDTERTSSGLPRGRVVGVVKSFDRWNTGMRNEPPHRRVEYLRGLAHLQRCMREHSCRYGFIMTEIELVCVRAGCDEGDDVPYFGFLELAAPIATKESSATFEAEAAKAAETDNSSDRPDSDDSSSGSASPPVTSLENAPGLNAPMTATLGLYFLLMLSKAVPLPSQPSGHLNVGGPGALTRQRILPEAKDKWIPEPQMSEKRVAKRVRGWVWPQDAWHRKEGSRPKGGAKSKKWHK